MIKLYNTLTRKKETFKPISDKEVKIYSCGPTVYNKAHIGNLRAFVFYDTLRRFLEFSGFKVNQVMNITDVDDKTIKGSRQEKVSLIDFTKKYTEIFFSDLSELGVEGFEQYPRATDHIKEMVELTKVLMKKGFAYKTSDGIYFSISKFKGYGKLANLDKQELKIGASGRVQADEYQKENPQDFALWKFWKEEDGDVFWETEIGKGRPGWHIECSAMSKKYLGDTFDIHTGGIDLVFPHHTNEIAQSEAATGKKFVNYWMHNAHLLIDGKKMSKSLGNFYTLEDIRKKGFDSTTLRYLFISSLYRQEVNLTEEKLEQARENVKRINDFYVSAKGEDNPEIPELIKKTEKKIKKAMEDDLNTPEALSSIFEFIKHANKLGAGELAGKFLKKIDKMFGLLKEHEVPSDIEALAVERVEARNSKDWKKSDQIRDKIKAKGWDIKDTKEGYVLSRI